MENLVIASQTSIFSLFGWGFLAGCLFGFGIMAIFEFITSLASKGMKLKN